MIMKKLLITMTILFPMIATCQVGPVNFKDCKIDQMFVSADIQPKWNCDTIGMVDFMNKFIEEKNLEKIEDGKILIGILIYPDGKTCCHSFGNFTKVVIAADKIKEVVNKMPNWTPAKQNGKEITFLKQQIFTIKNGKFIQD